MTWAVFGGSLWAYIASCTLKNLVASCAYKLGSAILVAIAGLDSWGVFCGSVVCDVPSSAAIRGRIHVVAQLILQLDFQELPRHQSIHCGEGKDWACTTYTLMPQVSFSSENVLLDNLKCLRDGKAGSCRK